MQYLFKVGKLVGKVRDLGLKERYSSVQVLGEGLVMVGQGLERMGVIHG